MNLYYHLSDSEIEYLGETKSIEEIDRVIHIRLFLENKNAFGLTSILKGNDIYIYYDSSQSTYFIVKEPTEEMIKQLIG